MTKTVESTDATPTRRHILAFAGSAVASAVALTLVGRSDAIGQLPSTPSTEQALPVSVAETQQLVSEAQADAAFARALEFASAAGMVTMIEDAVAYSIQGQEPLVRSLAVPLRDTSMASASSARLCWTPTSPMAQPLAIVVIPDKQLSALACGGLFLTGVARVSAPSASA